MKVQIQERDRNIILQSMKEGTFDEKLDRFMVVAAKIETDFYNNVKKNNSDATKDVLSKAWNGKHDEQYSVKIPTNYIAEDDIDLMTTVRSLDESTISSTTANTTVRNENKVNSMELLEIREKYDKLVSWTSELISQKDELLKRCEQLEEELKHAKNEYQKMTGEDDNKESFNGADGGDGRNRNEFRDINLQPDSSEGYSLFALIFGIIMSFLIGIAINRTLKLN